jgi:LysM repeat protein
MREAFVFLAQNYAYLLGVITALFALRVAWDAYRAGASPLASISRGIAMAITFFVVVKLAPALFEWGVNDAATRYQQGTVGRNLLSITEQGVNLAINATSPQTGTLLIPTPEPIVEFTSRILEEVTNAGSAQAAPAPAAAPGVAKPASNLAGPNNSQFFHPAPNDPTIPDLQEWILPAPTPLGNDLPRTNGQFAGPGGETVDQYMARTGQGGGGPRTYTVVSGDNLGKIAQRLGIDVGTLCHANRTVVRNNCNLLRTGMVLAIP